MIRDKDIEGRIKRGKKSQLKTQKEIKIYQRFENPATTLGGSFGSGCKINPINRT